MKQLRYSLSFTTPAFMGNAEQNAQWRTPPIKALLRQWWRVAYAADKKFSVCMDEMRCEEGLLFGHAWLEDDKNKQGEKVAARKSQIRIRLDRWHGGKLRQSDWPELGTVAHPEVPRAVASDLYLGYGPVTLPRGSQCPTLKANAAIQADEFATLSIAVPEADAPLIKRALWLIDRYGTLGGRSRNGWGSFAITPKDDASKLIGELVVHDWKQALTPVFDWPHAIGKDEKGALIWQTAPYDDWKSLMTILAEIKIVLRTQFKFPNEKPDGQVHERHWLSYPITRHSVHAWGNNARLPNTLRFKVRRTIDGKLVGIIFHVPHLPPAAFKPDQRTIEAVWKHTHAFLDNQDQKLTRISE